MYNQSNAQKLNALQNSKAALIWNENSRSFEISPVKVGPKTRVDRMIELGTVLMAGALIGMSLAIVNN